jgi:ABC-type uncharacterized transport system fused permease/ATPase subunit
MIVDPKQTLWLALPLGGVYLLFMVFYVVKTHEIQFTQNVLEGEFRTAHARLRANAESIAFFGTLESEAKLIRASFDAIVRNMMRRALIDWTRELIYRGFQLATTLNQTFIGGVLLCNFIVVDIETVFGPN